MATVRNPKPYIDIWVCDDCYTAHHFGCTEREGEWYAGESDQPADREPLSEYADWYDLADNVCFDHEVRGDGCAECGSSDPESGYDEFSMNSCDGCGSTLGGSRYRLAVWQKKGA